MALPTRAKQIQEVARWLDSEATADKSLDQIATAIVDGYHKLLLKELKKPMVEPHVGHAFKWPVSGKVHHVAWTDDERVWIVTADSNYGWFGPKRSGFWGYTEMSTAKAGTPGNNPQWQVGDRASTHQREFKFEVVATGDKCVLLREARSGELRPESNEYMKKFYHRETGAEIEW